jgi:hypothetical protein
LIHHRIIKNKEIFKKMKCKRNTVHLKGSQPHKNTCVLVNSYSKRQRSI